MKKAVGIFAVMALLASTTIAQAQTPTSTDKRSREHRGERPHEDRFASLPNITEVQKTKLKAIMDETKKTAEPQRAEMKALREKIQTARLADKPNQAEINSLIDKVHAQRAAMEKTRVAGEIKALSILTPEQQNAFKANMKQHAESRKEKRKAAPALELED